MTMFMTEQAPKHRSYASSKLCPLTGLLTGVRCRATKMLKIIIILMTMIMMMLMKIIWSLIISDRSSLGYHVQLSAHVLLPILCKLTFSTFAQHKATMSQLGMAMRHFFLMRIDPPIRILAHICNI